MLTSQPAFQMNMPSQPADMESLIMMEDLDPEHEYSDAYAVRPELMISTLLHLMSHYTANLHEAGNCIKLASVIERHLKALSDLPNVAPVLRATCEQLSEQWALIVDQAMPEPKKNGFFMRLIRNERIGSES